MSTITATPPGFLSACAMLRLGISPAVVEHHLGEDLGFEDAHGVVALALVHVHDERERAVGR